MARLHGHAGCAEDPRGLRAIEPGAPTARLKYIVENADVAVVLSVSHLEDLLPEVAAQTVRLDLVQAHRLGVRHLLPKRGSPTSFTPRVRTEGRRAGRGEQASSCDLVRVASGLPTAS